MRVQEFKNGVRLTCSREEFVQVRMALSDRRDKLFQFIRAHEGCEDFEYELNIVEHFMSVVKDMYDSVSKL